jgi:hypothetical protein
MGYTQAFRQHANPVETGGFGYGNGKRAIITRMPEHYGKTCGFVSSYA